MEHAGLFWFCDQFVSLFVSGAASSWSWTPWTLLLGPSWKDGCHWSTSCLYWRWALPFTRRRWGIAQRVVVGQTKQMRCLSWSYGVHFVVCAHVVTVMFFWKKWLDWLVTCLGDRWRIDWVKGWVIDQLRNWLDQSRSDLCHSVCLLVGWLCVFQD